MWLLVLVQSAIKNRGLRLFVYVVLFFWFGEW